MIYHVLGQMSGSSLDGIDLAFVRLEEQRGRWHFELLQAETRPYHHQWVERLKQATALNAKDLCQLDVEYAQLLAYEINGFIERHQLEHKINFIAAHGHTIFHEPALGFTCQIGHGGTLAAKTQLTVINDLRSVDVALGGQGAPIVPIGDWHLFPNHQVLVNLGGIANMTVKHSNQMQAMDVTACNQILNALADELGQPYDKDGQAARQGQVVPLLLHELNTHDWFAKPLPKSLSNAQAFDIGHFLLERKEFSVEDRLATFTEHIAEQLAMQLNNLRAQDSQLDQAQVLITGGGAHNAYLVERIQAKLEKHIVEVPDMNIVDYKESIVIAFIACLRWREEENVLAAYSGASRDSVGGAMWLS
jgi:anhydro-N-acetylmuramic acid kinase